MGSGWSHCRAIYICNALITAHIDKLPLVNKPDVFGLHPNAEIGYYTMAARNIWNSLIELQPQTGKWMESDPGRIQSSV